MKVQGEQLSGTNGLQTTRTNETARTAPQGRYGAVESGAAGDDSVQLSGLASRLFEAASTAPANRAERVASLAAIYARGDYKADAASLSRALVHNALVSSDGGKV